VSGHFALDVLRNDADIGEERLQDVQLLRQLIHPLLQTLVITHQQLQLFLGFTGAEFGLLARLADGDVVAFASSPVLVGAVVGAFAAFGTAGTGRR